MYNVYITFVNVVMASKQLEIDCITLMYTVSLRVVTAVVATSDGSLKKSFWLERGVVAVVAIDREDSSTLTLLLWLYIIRIQHGVENAELELFV